MIVFGPGFHWATEFIALDKSAPTVTVPFWLFTHVVNSVTFAWASVLLALIAISGLIPAIVDFTAANVFGSTVTSALTCPCIALISACTSFLLIFKVASMSGEIVPNCPTAWFNSDLSFEASTPGVASACSIWLMMFWTFWNFWIASAIPEFNPEVSIVIMAGCSTDCFSAIKFCNSLTAFCTSVSSKLSSPPLFCASSFNFAFALSISELITSNERATLASPSVVNENVTSYSLEYLSIACLIADFSSSLPAALYCSANAFAPSKAPVSAGCFSSSSRSCLIPSLRVVISSVRSLTFCFCASYSVPWFGSIVESLALASANSRDLEDNLSKPSSIVPK